MRNLPALPAELQAPQHPFLDRTEAVESYINEHVPATTDLTTVSGFNRITQAYNVRQAERIAECMEMWQDAFDGKINPFLLKQAFHPTEPWAFNELCRRYPAMFQETMSITDFDSLSANTLGSMVMQRWATMEPTYRKIAQVRDDIRDFRPETLYDFSGGSALWGESKELEGFDDITLAETTKTVTVKKYRKGASVSWEAIINDRLGLFRSLAEALALGAQNTLENLVTSMWVGTTGLNSSLFTSANTVTGNPALSFESLSLAIEMWMNLEDVDGIPITARGATLVVTSGHTWMIAQQIKNALSVDSNLAYSGGKTNDRVRMSNWMMQNLEIVYAPWARKIATSNASTTWAMFANPGNGRAAIVLAFLQGFSGVQLFRKSPNTQTMGGSPMPALGDFDIMATRMSGLIVPGVAYIDAKSAIGSNGSGS